MATGIIGGFTESVGADVARYPDYYRETRDGPQILFLTVLHDFGWLKQPPRDHLHTDRALWADHRARNGWIKTTCSRCGCFIGRRPA
jgi:hypothetical protein